MDERGYSNPMTVNSAGRGACLDFPKDILNTSYDDIDLLLRSFRAEEKGGNMVPLTVGKQFSEVWLYRMIKKIYRHF